MEVDKIFSGYQPYQLVKIADVSGTISAPVIVVDSPRRFYQLSHPESFRSYVKQLICVKSGVGPIAKTLNIGKTIDNAQQNCVLRISHY